MEKKPNLVLFLLFASCLHPSHDKNITIDKESSQLPFYDTSQIAIIPFVATEFHGGIDSVCTPFELTKSDLTEIEKLFTIGVSKHNAATGKVNKDFIILTKTNY